MKPAIILLIGIALAGCADRVPDENPEGDAAPEAQAPGAAAAPAQDNNAPQEDAADKPVPITKREAKLVDKKQALQENPALVEVENKITAGDTLTAVAQSYFTIGSKAQVLAMQRSIQIQKELNNRWPTFEEFEKSLKQAGVQLQGLYAYQMYAYDEDTGGIVILEDRAEKKRQYEAAGREYPHDD